MENHEKNSVEALKARQAELASKITALEAAGEKNAEWNRLNNEYEELGVQIEQMQTNRQDTSAEEKQAA